MVRHEAQTDDELAACREACGELVEFVEEEMCEAVTARAVPGDEYGDVEVSIEGRDLSSESEEILNLTALFREAGKRGFNPHDGAAHRRAVVGTANYSTDFLLYFDYTYPGHR